MFQKIFTLFNNKLRMYDYNSKTKNVDRSLGLDSPLKKHGGGSNNELDLNFTSPKKNSHGRGLFSG